MQNPFKAMNEWVNGAPGQSTAGPIYSPVGKIFSCISAPVVGIAALFSPSKPTPEYQRVLAERDVLLGAVTMTPELQTRLDKISNPEQ